MVVRIIRNQTAKLNGEGLISIEGIIILTLDLHRLVLIPVGSQEADVVCSCVIIRAVDRNLAFRGITGSHRHRHSTGRLAVELDGKERHGSRFSRVSTDGTDADSWTVIIGVGHSHIRWDTIVIVRSRRC